MEQQQVDTPQFSDLHEEINGEKRCPDAPKKNTQERYYKESYFGVIEENNRSIFSPTMLTPESELKDRQSTAVRRLDFIQELKQCDSDMSELMLSSAFNLMKSFHPWTLSFESSTQ